MKTANLTAEQSKAILAEPKVLELCTSNSAWIRAERSDCGAFYIGTSYDHKSATDGGMDPVAWYFTADAHREVAAAFLLMAETPDNPTRDRDTGNG